MCLLGANGAGKTTTLNCICGVVPLAAGRIRFEDEDIAGLSIDRIVARGIVQVPEGREIFPEMTVSRQSVAWLLAEPQAASPGCSSGSTIISRG